MPQIVHGSTPTDGKRRRTILPWFVGINQDGIHLEYPKSDTLDELRTAHSQQTAPKCTPSGHAHMYGTIPYRFEAGTRLELDSSISGALLGRIPWQDAEVVYEANLLLSYNWVEADNLRMEHRLMALRQFKMKFKKMMKMEMNNFQHFSFFKNSQ